MYLLKSLSSKAGKAAREHEMLKDKDRILICFSGGKDSYALLKIMQNLKKNYPITFELKVLCVNPGFDKNFENKIKEILDKEDIKYEILNSKIQEVLENQQKIKDFRPCFMCSRLRRGIIYNYAIKNNFNKIALGHNLDDGIQTHLMNFFYSSKFSYSNLNS
ncbi:MAG: ATP-binding protein [Nanoarchaeota archaeon]